MGKVEAVIFDWNGTLYDDLERLAYGSVIKIFETYGIPPPTLGQYRQEISASFMKFYYSHGFAENFSGQGKDGDAKALNVIRAKYYSENGEKGSIRPDAFLTVLGLKMAGIRVGIVSAEINQSLLDRLNSSDLGELFDRNFIKTQVWGDKGPALFEMCGKFGVSPADVIYVDDTVDGTSSAQRAGLVPVGFGNSTGYNSEDRLRTVTQFVIHQLSELPVLIEKLNNSLG